VSIIGILALVTAVALNMRHAFNDYGIKDNKLHVEIFGQANTTNGDTTDKKKAKEGPTQNTEVECTITETTTTTSNCTTGSNSNWGASGNLGANWGAFSGGLSGNYTSGSNSNQGNSTTTITTTTRKFKAKKYYCPGQTESSCSPYDLC
jgi:hypothetical protein